MVTFPSTAVRAQCCCLDSGICFNISILGSFCLCPFAFVGKMCPSVLPSPHPHRFSSRCGSLCFPRGLCFEFRTSCKIPPALSWCALICHSAGCRCRAPCQLVPFSSSSLFYLNLLLTTIFCAFFQHFNSFSRFTYFISMFFYCAAQLGWGWNRFDMQIMRFCRTKLRERRKVQAETKEKRMPKTANRSVRASDSPRGGRRWALKLSSFVLSWRVRWFLSAFVTDTSWW